MDMTDEEKVYQKNMITVLKAVFDDLGSISGQLEPGVFGNYSTKTETMAAHSAMNKEKRFLDLLKTVVAVDNLPASLESLTTIPLGDLTSFYSKVKELVNLLEGRLPEGVSMSAKSLMDEMRNLTGDIYWNHIANEANEENEENEENTYYNTKDIFNQLNGTLTYDKESKKATLSHKFVLYSINLEYDMNDIPLSHWLYRDGYRFEGTLSTDAKGIADEKGDILLYKDDQVWIKKDVIEAYIGKIKGVEEKELEKFKGLGFSNVDAMELADFFLVERELEEVRELTKSQLVETYFTKTLEVSSLDKEILKELITHLEENSIEETTLAELYLLQQILATKKLMEIDLDNVGKEATDPSRSVIFPNGSVGIVDKRIAGYSWKYLGKDGDNWRFEAMKRESGYSSAALDHLREITGAEYGKVEKEGFTNNIFLYSGKSVVENGKNLDTVHSNKTTITVIRDTSRDDNKGDSINYSFVANMEGSRLIGYVPTKDGVVIASSGVTIATGFDIGSHDIGDLKNIFRGNDYLIALYSQYTEKQKTVATTHLLANPLYITQDQADITDELVKTYKRGQTVKEYNTHTEGDFYALPSEAQTVLHSLGFHRGAEGIPDDVMNLINGVTDGDYNAAANALLVFSKDVEKGDYDGRRRQEAAYLKRSMCKDAYKTLTGGNFSDLSDKYKVLVLVLGYQKAAPSTFGNIMGLIRAGNCDNANTDLYDDANTAIEDLYNTEMYTDADMVKVNKNKDLEKYFTRADIFHWDKVEINNVGVD